MPGSTIPDSFMNQVANLHGLITVVVNDGTRPSPGKYLSLLRPALSGRVRFLFATGTHRPVTVAEKKYIMGEIYSDDILALSHQCDDGTQVYIGTTSRGTEVAIHPWLLEGPVLALNTVEPHYFAGFTGGRKSFLPGVSSRKTVVQNHYLACLSGALPGKLSGNPVHEDMMEGTAFLSSRTEVLMLNGVSGSNSLFCGPHDSTFYSACQLASERSGIPLDKKFTSLEVKPGQSLEVSLYQAMKAVFLWESSVEDGGDLVLSASCPEALGANQMERLLHASSTSIAVPRSSEEYSLGDHAAIRLRKIRRRISLSFRTGIDMRRYGFSIPPERCEVTLNNAGFTYPVMGTVNA